MVRKGYTSEQIINKLRKGEALKTASSRGYSARANDSNSSLRGGMITGDRSLLPLVLPFCYQTSFVPSAAGEAV